MTIPGARRGLMLVLSSPSGAGKTTMSKRLLEAESNLRVSVSVTTRPPRAGEVDGVDYHFVSEATFNELVSANHFLEHAVVFGNRYGSPKEPVRSALEAGADVLFDVDWQGTRQLVENQFRRTDRDADVVSIFLLPPSMPELERRLRSRAADPEEVIRFRMNRSREEISHWAEYDYVLVNDDPDTCLAEIRAILAAERLRRDRQQGLAGFVRSLLEGEDRAVR